MQDDTSYGDILLKCMQIDCTWGLRALCVRAGGLHVMCDCFSEVTKMIEGELEIDDGMLASTDALHRMLSFLIDCATSFQRMDTKWSFVTESGCVNMIGALHDMLGWKFEDPDDDTPFYTLTDKFVRYMAIHLPIMCKKIIFFLPTQRVDQASYVLHPAAFTRALVMAIA